MEEQNHIIIGASVSVLYAILNDMNIIMIFLIAIIGVLLGKATYYAEKKKETEYNKLIIKNNEEKHYQM